MKRKHISLILACSMALNFMPQVSTLANATTDKTVVFSNDFESSNLPDEIGGILTSKDVSIEKAGGSKALKISSKFDGTDDWDNNKHEIAFNTESTDLPEGTKIEYDILIPSSNKFTGIMKSAGGFSIYDGSEWGWASLDCGDIKYSDFEDLGNGYSKVHVATPLNEEVKGVRKLDIQIDSYLCTYEGYMYLDNIQIVKPKSQASTATNDKTIFFSDFEANQKPSRVDGVLTSKSIGIKKVNDSNALKVNVKFDGTDDWDNNKHEMIFDVKSDDAVTTAAKLEFDLLIPTANKGFDGLFKVAGGFSTFDGDNWGWVNNSGTEMKSSDFKDLGNGYSIKHVVLNPSDTIEGLQNINIQLESYMCDYKGEAYIDNLRFHETKAGEEVEAPTTGLMWDFNDAAKGLDGWKYDSVYAYDGPHDVSYDKDFTGSGSLKLDVKYNPTDSWSEVKIDKWINEGVNLGEYNTIKFNLYYNPANMTKGTFKSQFWANSDVNKSADIDLTKAEYLGNGISKVPVSITYTTKDIKTNILILSVVGSNTDYEGALYIDDINLTKKEVKDPYVKVSATPTKNPTKVDISSLDIENSVQLADSESTKETASLFAYLKALGKTKYALFGHQNPSTYKAGPKDSGNDSDVEDLTGTLPGVCGIDALCFTGSELQAKPGTDLVTATADVCKAEAKKGSIITLSAHMPNFALVAEKPKKNGQYDYSGYTVNDLSGNTAQRILPGGDLNEVYNGYLDMIADYGKQMEQAGIPVLFRPFHECTGNWFWWGTAACDDDTYKSLFDYTVEYLRDTKGVHNFLYVYSTAGGFNSKDELMSRYPGDAFTDVIAFDQYHNNPKGGPDEDQWFQNLKDCVKMCDEAAAEHGKISTLSETGIATTKGKLYEQDGATAVSGNRDKDWYQHVAEIVSESDMPYFLVWANFAKDNFYVPYMVDGERGHEMVDNFINYYNEENSVFANGVGDYRSFDVNVEGALDYGYIESPASGSRILEPTTIKAKVSSKSSDVKYVVKVKDEVIDTLNAKLNEVSGLYEAEISQDLLDKIGGKVGKIELTIDDKAVASGKYIFNIPEPVEKNELVDDFESYGDENELLQGVWKTNAGTGCTITPELGKFGKNHYLKFKYNINTSVLDEGYAGIIKAKKCDWSAYDAVEISINPDGYGQKLVIQITSNGEDFEVHLPEFAATTEAKTLRIPFSQFKGKQNGKFDPSNITSFGLWCNTIVPEGHEGVWTVDSEFEFDNFHACNMSDAKPEEDAVKEATLAVEKAENSKASSDIEVAEKLVKALNESAEKTALQARITKLKASLNPSTQDTVVIEDMNLKLAILNELKKPVTAEITKADMLKLKNFDVKNKNIKSLSGLEYAKNLRMLDLTGNNVSDISNIKGLKGLKYLTLFGNDISDESAEDLASMTQLLSLNLDHTKISNIDFVKGMANLRNLYVSYTDVADLTPVIGLTHLKILYFNYTKVTSLKFLYDCRSINVIGYTGCDCQPDSGMFWQLKNIQVK
ncbi:MAG: mannanase [Clostridium sp.]|jgi:mannan endo-1,4-beta-mannosidase|nr:mannanase [Clostridium sp.]